MSNINFLIIGAQKGGTTSLFEYMRRHPRIHMPPEKEIEFFNRDHVFRRGWDWYLGKMTRGASPDAVCGEASTYYMSGRPGDVLGEEYQEPRESPRNTESLESLEEVIPGRIKHFLPEVKLICVLRDPVARAYSAYRMMRMARTESRSFDEAIDQLLAPKALDEARAVPTMTNGYIVMGEYCRVLAGFSRVFPQEQLMVLFTDELAERPADTLAAVFKFVGVEADFVADNLNSRYREAAVKGRIPGLHLVRWQANLARTRSARTLWHALPTRVRWYIDRASYRAVMWNAKRGVAGDDMSQSVRERLRAHFRPDGEALEDLLKRNTPWLATWAQSSMGEPSGVTSIESERSRRYRPAKGNRQA